MTLWNENMKKKRKYENRIKLYCQLSDLSEPFRVCRVKVGIIKILQNHPEVSVMLNLENNMWIKFGKPECL